VTSGELVLIIDDEELLRGILRCCLEELGLRVQEAEDGPSGVACARREMPDLVLLDIMMPGMNGYETCRAIHALEGAEGLPVIVMTGHVGGEHQQRAFQSGAVDYLTKPLSIGDVKVRVMTHLGLRRKSLALAESNACLAKAFDEAAAMNRNLLHLNGKLRRSEAVKSRFLALMRNEIYNPLNDIQGLAGRILDESLPPAKARELAALIRNESFLLDLQIRNVLCAADLEAGEVRPTISRVNFGSVARDILESFGPFARDKGLDLILEVTGAGPDFPTDSGKLHQILCNLVANAVKCSPQGGRVRLALGAGEMELTLRVEDQGPGLSAEARRALFVPFHGSEEDARFHQGPGLGLPVVKSLIDILEGALSLDSEEGRGSRFTITLPRIASLEQMEAEAMDGNLLFFDDPQEF
jgi:signal transduction histidine kinase